MKKGILSALHKKIAETRITIFKGQRRIEGVRQSRKLHVKKKS